MYTCEEVVEWITQEERFYLYGAGKMCDEFCCVFEALGLWDKVKAIFVTECLSSNIYYHEKPVIEFSRERVEKNIPILVTVKEHHQKEILVTLKNQGITNCVCMTNEVIDAVLGYLGVEAATKKIINYAKNNKEKAEEDILFFSPPYWDVYSPFSAVPCLAAKLLEEGYKVKQVDLGIHCIRQVIQFNWREIAGRCLCPEFYEKNFLDYEKNNYSTYEEYVDDLWFFQGEEFDIEQIKQGYEAMNHVQKRVIDSFYNIAYAWELMDISFDKCKDLEKATYAKRNAKFVEHLSHANLIGLFAKIPEVVGISVTSTMQFLPGYLLAKIIKLCKPETTVVMGGSCADLFVKSNYKNKKDINKYIDYMIVGEGETAIAKLMEYIKGGKKGEVDSIPNLVLVDKNNEVRYTEQIIENVGELPLANYDGLDLSLYLAPRVIMPYQTSRGCHYGQCAFCNHDAKYRHNYRSKDMKLVVEELLELSRRYNIRDFQFVDEAIRPDCFVDMVEEMDKHQEFGNIQWFYYSRVSRVYTKEILQKAKKNGCKMVMFGIETLNQRLLKHIKKGISAETSSYCLKLFHESGIKTYAWLLCNLPSETLEEAREDMENIRAIDGMIDAFSVNPFMLFKNTDMYDRPELYGITSINPDNELLFQSEYAGCLIDKEAMLDFYYNEYLAYQKRKFSSGNRYTLYFE